MAASTAWRTHRNTCSPCRSGQHCETGAQLFERFARLQDAYLAEQRRKR
ncbi:hypothetical protein [Streptomyces drozdowiczii]|uniref:Uncharacterized protein n=1 Tax=Streptomyces drozdowiczii TaxID=202862 RepID=A0ABY6Q2G3_9ACTN|nr:hypothetical protein [Streptomyces drozdowiczii]MCX0247931.1 hypothetical protein [Streptomyces drozdowiczii]UZK58219.1 hypothetical protein NEH16_32795 [Streptomyces drozdowiczii]